MTILAILALHAVGYARDPTGVTVIRLYSDGSAEVQQERNCVWDPASPSVSLRIAKPDSGAITVNQVARMGWHRWAPGLRWRVEEDPAFFRVRWACPGKSRAGTFLIEYTVTRAVRRYLDCARFAWQALDEQTCPVNGRVVNIILPSRPGQTPRVLRPGKGGYRTIQGALLNPSQELIHVTLATTDPGCPTYFELLTDPALFSQVPLQTGNYSSDSLPGDMQSVELQRSPPDRKTLEHVRLGLLLILSPFALILAVQLLFGRRPRLAYYRQYEHEPPRFAPPVVVPAIIHLSGVPEDAFPFLFQGMLATLLDLNCQGLISIREVVSPRARCCEFALEKPIQDMKLEPLTRSVLKFFFERMLGDRSMITDAEIRQCGGRNFGQLWPYLSDLYNRAVDWWQRELGVQYLTKPVVPVPAVFGFVSGLMAWMGILSLEALVPHSSYMDWGILLTWLVAVGLGRLAFALARRVVRCSTLAYQEARRWLAFRRFLADFSAIEQAGIELYPVWEQYFVQATALGVAREFLASIGDLATSRSIQFRLAASIGGAADFVSSLGEAMVHVLARAIRRWGWRHRIRSGRGSRDEPGRNQSAAE